MLCTRKASLSTQRLTICRYGDKNGVSVTIQDLPDIMIMQIFSHMSVHNLCVVARVCKRWMKLSYDSGLWKFVDLSQFKSVNPIVIMNLIQDRFSPLLRFLDLSSCQVSTKIISELGSSCRGLEALRLSNCIWKLESNDEVDFPKQLSCFDIRDFGGDYTLLMEIFDGLTVSKRLRFLGFGNCLSCDVAFSSFKKQLFTLENLTVLEICDSEDVGDALILELAEKLGRLKSITLRRCPRFTGTTLPKVVDRLPFLATFVLFRTGITDHSLMAPSWSLLALQELDLSFNDSLTNHSLQDVLPRMPYLRYLSINNCGRGHAFNENVANTINVTNCFRHLETLSLQFCKHLEGHILELILNCCNLKHLSVRSSHNVTFGDVAKVTQYLPSLVSLEVGALFSLDENGKEWDKLLIKLGKNCQSLENLTLVKCYLAPRAKLRELKAAIRFFLTKCTRLRQVCILYSESTIGELFVNVLSYKKFSQFRKTLRVSLTSGNETIPPTTNSLDYYLQHSYLPYCK